MSAALAAVIPTSRRVSAGIKAEPGATSRLPAWWGRADWLEVEVPAALDERPEVLKDCHVSRGAVLTVARAMASFADFRTGRDCRPTNEKLVEAARCSLSTVLRARKALKRLGLVAVLVKGRSMMNRAERLAAHAAGSAHRQIAAEFALLSKRRRAPKVRATQVGEELSGESAPTSSVDRDNPPGALSRKLLSHLSSTHLRRQTENEEGGQAPRSYRGGSGGQARRLAEGVRDRFPWLHGTSYKRLAPGLGKFARSGWTVRDFEIGIRDLLAARGHRIPGNLRHPAAYLAGLLRDLDPADRPSVLEDAYEAARRAEAAAERAGRRARVLALAGKCPHGVPAHGAGQPSRGVLACLECHRGTL